MTEFKFVLIALLACVLITLSISTIAYPIEKYICRNMGTQMGLNTKFSGLICYVQDSAKTWIPSDNYRGLNFEYSGDDND